MNGNQAGIYDQQRWMAMAAARGQPAAVTIPSGLSISGFFLFLMGLAVYGSGVSAFRASIGFLRLQPYLVPLAIAGPFVLMSRIKNFPSRTLAGLLSFGFLYTCALIGPTVFWLSPTAEATKIWASIFAIVVVALMVRTRTDFLVGACGLAIAIGLLAFRGLQDEGAGADRLIDIANKNSYSLYALPVVLLAGYVALWVPGRWLVLKPALVLSALYCALAIFAGSNRSGYLGVGVIVGLLVLSLILGGRLSKALGGTFLVLMLSLALAFWLVRSGRNKEFNERVQRTEEGYASDQLRFRLFKECLIAGIENPILGVSPQKLPLRLAQRSGANEIIADAHNAMGEIIGGTGFLTFFALVYTGTTLFFYRPTRPVTPDTNPRFFNARSLLRMMVVLWVVRSMFSREIIYNPSFCIGIGLAIGLCLLEEGVYSTAEPVRPRATIASGLPRAVIMPARPTMSHALTDPRSEARLSTSSDHTFANGLRSARVGFISPRSFFRGDGAWTDAGLGRLVDALRAECGGFTLAACPSPRRLPLFDHRVSVPEADLLELPELPSIGRGFLKIASCRRVIREVERRSDVLIVQLPLAATLALVGPRRPRVYHLCADIWEFARRSSRFTGLKRLPALAVGGFIDRVQARLFRGKQVRLVTNGETLRTHYGHPPGRAVVSSTILDREIMSVPRRRPAGGPFRILYVGYLRHEKGTDTLVDAFEQVINVLPDAELEVVGAREPTGRHVAERFEQALDLLGRRATVRFLGHRNFGPDLFQCFADADVLVVPSRTEGTPRVLVEARAFGCPVIGTRVGGIPTSIDDGVDGLLVPPEDPRAVAEAILRVARDGALRQRLIAGGIERARRSTVDCFARALADEAAQLIGQTKS